MSKYNIEFLDTTTRETLIIYVVQGDSARTLEFEPTDYTIPSGATATYYVAKPSGESVYNAATISDNVVTVPLTAQALAESGENFLQVRLSLNDTVLTSFAVVLNVRPFGGDAAVESTSEATVFDQLLSAAQESIISDTVEEWLEDHPEATTTVQDGSLTVAKFTDNAKLYVVKDYVTPQMYGAVGDGETDDTDAIADAITLNSCVFFPSGVYNVAFADSETQKQVMFSLKSGQRIVFDKDAVINVVGEEFASLSSVFGFTEFPVSDIVIDGATIQCESVYTINPMGIRFETAADANAEQITNVFINDCVFKNLDSAVYIVQRRTTGVETRQTKNVFISNCKGYSCLSSFVTADGENITIQNCFADGENNARAYDAVSIHSGINIKVLNNVFQNYTAGQVINIRNSPENYCGTNDVIVDGNSIVDCTTTAIQISAQSGESTYGVTNIAIIENKINTCSTGITISCGSATSGTPFKNFTVNSNIVEGCTRSANLQSNTTVWNERITISNNIFANSGNFAMSACRHCTFTGNYINLASNAVFSATYLFYAVFCDNVIWTDVTTITFNSLANCSISNNLLRGTVVLTTSATLDFIGNDCMNTITINSVAGFNIKTDYRHGLLTAYSSAYPTASTNYTYAVGDMYINQSPSSGVYAWICTVSGSPGTWKAISLS